MKFAEHLGAHITPEWRKQYIQYEAMKEMLYEATESAPSPEAKKFRFWKKKPVVTDQSTIQRYFARFDERFFQYCDKELAKINTFFSEKMAEASRKYANLQTELQSFSEQSAMRSSSKENARADGIRNRRSSVYTLFKDRSESNTVANGRKLHDLKLAFSEFYLSLILLQNYQTLNFTGFRKILKKHDKLMQTERGTEWRQAHVETSRFYTSKEVDHMIKETEQVVTTDLEGGNRQKAMKRLRVPPLGDEQNPWTTFRVGLFSGIFGVLLVVIVVAANFTEHSETWEAALRMYRGTFLIILKCFLLGINTYGWRSSGVNHVLIFELDPRNHLSHQQLLEVATCLAVIWAISVLAYLFSAFIYIPVFASPLALACLLVLFLLNPIHILHFRARMWLLKVLCRIFTAPFHHVGFADFWLADQLNSLVTVLLDFEYLVCYYAFKVKWHGGQSEAVCTKNVYGHAIRGVVACLPAWWRFAQCLRRYRDTKLVFPHVVNAGKYSTTFLVVIFAYLYKHHVDTNEETRQNNAYFYLWIVSAVISSCYTFTWDIKMDWGLFDEGAGDNKFLREEIVYAYKSYYYFAIIEDFILRFAWSLNVSVGEGIFHSEILSTILSSFEVFRRFVWNYFRLENEHLNNCGQFRAVRDISIAPIDSNEQSLLEEMMDDVDGTNTRRTDRRRFIGKKKKESRVWIDDDRNELLGNLKVKNV